MKTTVDLPEELLRQAKAEAARRGWNLRELFTHGILCVLNEPSPAASPGKAGRFADGCGIVNSGGGDLSSHPKHMEAFGRVEILPSFSEGRQ